MDKLETSLEKVKEQMTDPASAVVENSETTKEKKVATKKTPKKKVAAVKAAKTNGHAKDTDGLVSLKALCSTLKMAPRLARIKLRKAEIENPGRWAWREGSGELTKVRKLLSAASE
jgi:hypothetical protein